MKIKKTGSRRRIEIHREEGSSSRDSAPTTGQSLKSTCFHLSPFRAIAPSGELLLGPSRSSATTASAPSAAAWMPSSLLASSCSGPSRQDERMIARLIPSPGELSNHFNYQQGVTSSTSCFVHFRHRPRLAGIWAGGFTPGTPVSTQRQKMSKRHKTTKRTLFFRGFPPGTPVSTLQIDEKISKKRHRNFMDNFDFSYNFTFLVFH